jgi:hypothetical protein
MTRIPTFECPSEDIYQIYENANGRIFNRTFTAQLPGTGPAIAAGFNKVSAVAPDRVGLTSYLGVAGNAGLTGYVSPENWDQWVGVFNANSKTSIVDVTAADGTSNVLMFGEIFGYVRDATTPSNDTAYSWIGCGLMWNNIGLPATPRLWAFGSRHGGVVNFVSCDGAVRALRSPTLSPGDAYNAYIYLCGFKDGRAFDPSLVAN